MIKNLMLASDSIVPRCTERVWNVQHITRSFENLCELL